MKVKPTEEPVRRSPKVLEATPVPSESPLEQTAALVLPTNGAEAADTSTMVMLDHLWAKLREVESAVSARNDQPPPADPRLDALSNAVSGLAGGLDRLFAEMRALHELPGRLQVLEGRLAQRPQGRAPFDQGLADTVEHLAAKVDELGHRMEALERAPERAQGSAGAQQLEQLAAKVASVDKVTSRVTALEQSKRTSTDRDLATLAGRVTRLERGETRDGEKAATPTKLLGELERLSARVAVLEKAPKPPPGQSERLAATEKGLEALVRDLERLAAQVAGLAEMPKRVAALEENETPPSEKVLASITKRLDRLSTQVANYKDIPARVQAAEQDAARTTALSRGLHRAIESIDQLSAQVNSLGSLRPAGAPPRPAPAPVPPRFPVAPAPRPVAEAPSRPAPPDPAPSAGPGEPAAGREQPASPTPPGPPASSSPERPDGALAGESPQAPPAGEAPPHPSPPRS